jgi:hypothetical protein
MRVIRQVFLAAVAGVTQLLGAQTPDSLHAGDRVRVRVAATRGNTNLFVGNVASISPETLVVDIPGGKATTTLPRAAISEVAITEGRESRFANVPRALPFLFGPSLLSTTPSTAPGPHASAYRNRRFALNALSSLPLIMQFRRTPAEQWRPVYSWLEGRQLR